MLVAIADVLLLQEIVIIGLGLFVTARQVGELLLPDRLLIQTCLIIIDLRLQSRDRVFLVGDLDLIGLQLALDLNRRGPAWASPRGRDRLWPRPGRLAALVRPSDRPEAGFSHLFRLRNLFLQLTHVGMTIGVVGAEVGELRSESCPAPGPERVFRRACRPRSWTISAASRDCSSIDCKYTCCCLSALRPSSSFCS